MSKVHFVGAGPGDVELITLKGYKQLSEADVVIYAGSLVNPDLLNYCKEGAEIHDSASMHLMEIIDVMEDGVKAGKDVVRLQTGDFSIYGSIREQIEEMKKRDIEFDCTWRQLFSGSCFQYRGRVYRTRGFSKPHHHSDGWPDACARSGIPEKLCSAPDLYGHLPVRSRHRKGCQ